MKIITVDREFGSGGRELGKRLADALNIPCYDQEVIEEVAKLHGLDPHHVEHISETDIHTVYPRTIGRHFAIPHFASNDTVKVAIAQQEVVKKLAGQGDCVIVGHGADIVLWGEKTMNIFVYADHASKLERCLSRAAEGETETDICRQMKLIDKNRAIYHELLTDTKWGRKESYHLCINTSGRNIKTLVPLLAAYVSGWFEND